MEENNKKVLRTLSVCKPLFSEPAVLAGKATFLTENITQDRKRFITQSKHMIF